MALYNLNREQLQVVQTADGHVAVAAGPGTGKTHTLACRIAYLIREKRLPPRQILAVTFTRSAAQEMRERVKSMLAGTPFERDLSELWIETFHAAALRILREQSYPFGDKTNWTLASEEEKLSFVNGLVPAKEIPEFLERVRRHKQRLEPHPEVAALEYQRRLHKSCRLDFDDLFIETFRLFNEHTDVLRGYRLRFQYIIADEFQDTSFAQYQFLKMLAGKNVCVLGDPDQAIYGFQSGGFRPFQQFRHDFPSCKIFALRENYRSQSMILEAAQQVIERNPAQLPRELKARLEQGLPIEISGHETEAQEAEMIARAIEGLIGGASTFTIDTQWAKKGADSGSYGWNDIAILYRFHSQARAIAKVLERAGLPHQIYAKPSPQDAEAQVSRTDDLEDYQNAAGVRGEGIRLMTLHRSKGLEFPVVFVLGCEEGVLPHCGAELSDEEKRLQIEEERRLFYVGMTRAKNRLFLSHAKKRFLFGQTLAEGPSSFLKDIEEQLRVLQKHQPPARKKPQAAQLQLF